MSEQAVTPQIAKVVQLAQTTNVCTLSDYSSMATIIACVIGIISFIVIIYQLIIAKKTLDAQLKATEADVYTNLNSQFLAIITPISSKIHNQDATLVDLTDEEARAIDRYFYLANTEHLLIKRGVIHSDEFVTHINNGIESSATKKTFVERWKSEGSNFKLSDSFKAEYNGYIVKHSKK